MFAGNYFSSKQLSNGYINRELTNRRLSHDAAAGSRHSFALPSRSLEFTIRSKDDDVGARGR